MEEPQRVEIGEITGAYGGAGAVWVRPLTDVPNRHRTLAGVLLVRDGAAVAAQVTSAREVEGRWLVTLEGTATREGAAALAGTRLAVEPAASPPLPEGAWYVRDLVGRAVVAEDGRALGTVTDVVRTGANDCWEISGPDGDLLFPALRALVVAMPAGTGAITVRVPPGLLEACLTKRKP